MSKQPKKFRIGQQYVSIELSQVVLVELRGTPENCHVEKIEDLSQPIEDADALRQEMMVISQQRAIPWDLRMVPGHKIVEWRVKGGRQHPNQSTLPVHVPRVGLRKAIAKLHQKVRSDSARFADFKNLKSGNDEFSQLRGDKLLALIPPDIQDALSSRLDGEELADPEFRNRIYRWWLRGLEIEVAVRKVRVDGEVSHNAAIANLKRN